MSKKRNMTTFQSINQHLFGDEGSMYYQIFRNKCLMMHSIFPKTKDPPSPYLKKRTKQKRKIPQDHKQCNEREQILKKKNRSSSSYMHFPQTVNIPQESTHVTHHSTMLPTKASQPMMFQADFQTAFSVSRFTSSVIR